jgi:hypothetical protein
MQNKFFFSHYKFEDSRIHFGLHQILTTFFHSYFFLFHLSSSPDFFDFQPASEAGWLAALLLFYSSPRLFALRGQREVVKDRG